MKYHLLILLPSIILVNCNRKAFVFDDGRYAIIDNEYAGDFINAKEYFDNGILSAEGHYAIDEIGDPSSLRVGEWIDYYETGIVKSKGQYEAGSYIQCCTAGPCRQYYSYKSGYWEYYYPNNQLKASGEYESRKLHIDTSCEDGDDFLYGLTNGNWAFYDSNGLKIHPTPEVITELETVEHNEYQTTMLLFPDSSKENTEMKVKQ